MAKTKEIEVVEETTADEGYSLLNGVRRILMAGVGALALAQEEVEEFVNKLVERGEIAEKDGRKLISDIRERRGKVQEEASKQTHDRWQSMSDGLEKRMENILDRLNIPTRSDIETLSKKISVLAEKVDELKKNGHLPEK